MLTTVLLVLLGLLVAYVVLLLWQRRRYRRPVDLPPELGLPVIGPKGRCLGNPQLGVADPTKEPPWVYAPDRTTKLYQAAVCEDCGGYYFAECPCWFQGGGRYNRPEGRS